MLLAGSFLRLRVMVKSYLARTFCLCFILLLAISEWVLAKPDQTPERRGALELRPHVIAHRGGRKWAPENTLAAFRKSIAAGVSGIELDIHRCKSGELVVIHDDDLSRTTNGSGAIKDRTYSEISKLSAGSWFAPEFSQERVPLLRSVLELIDGRAVLNIEIKNAPTAYPGIEDNLLGLLDGYKHKEKILISSFDHEVLRRIHRKAPQYRLAFLVDGLLVDIGNYAKSIGASAWNPCLASVRGDSVAAAHAAGLEVNVWTVNDKKAWDSAIAMGVDGIVTDDPEGLLAYCYSLKPCGKVP